MKGESAENLSLDGTETYSFSEVSDRQKTIDVEAKREDGETINFSVKVRIDTESEWEYYAHEGILHYVLRNLA